MITVVLVLTSSTTVEGQAHTSNMGGTKRVIVTYPGLGFDPYESNFNLFSTNQWNANTLAYESFL